LNTKLLRQTWNLIETTNAWDILESSESEFIQELLRRIEAQKPLPEREKASLYEYLHEKMSLIRDTAESRLVSA